MMITEMRSEHVAQVAALEKLCFGTEAWSENSVASELNNQLALWVVAVDGDRVAGYVGSQTVCDETDMMNIAVHPDYRRQKLGTALITNLIEALAKRGSHSLTLEVRASNDPAIAMYTLYGFEQVGRRKNYYRNPKEDALILRKEWEL